MQATDKDWVTLQGKFLLNGSPSKVILYLEGPPPGTDILLNSLVLKHAAKATPSTPPDVKVELMKQVFLENYFNNINASFSLKFVLHRHYLRI